MGRSQAEGLQATMRRPGVGTKLWRRSSWRDVGPASLATLSHHLASWNMASSLKWQWNVSLSKALMLRILTAAWPWASAALTNVVLSRYRSICSSYMSSPFLCMCTAGEGWSLYHRSAMSLMLRLRDRWHSSSVSSPIMARTVSPGTEMVKSAFP